MNQLACNNCSARHDMCLLRSYAHVVRATLERNMQYKVLCQCVNSQQPSQNSMYVNDNRWQ